MYICIYVYVCVQRPQGTLSIGIRFFFSRSVLGNGHVILGYRGDM